MIEITQATTKNELDAVRALSHAFTNWLKELNPDAQGPVNQYFESLEVELASLPGNYAPPAGRLLLAYSDGVVAGTIALRDIGNHICEMKRLFVHPGFHGQGIERALATTIISESRKYGYSRMRLETSPGQVAALGLYRSLGFREIPPYYDIPEELRTNMVFMELRLQVHPPNNSAEPLRLRPLGPPLTPPRRTETGARSRCHSGRVGSSTRPAAAAPPRPRP